MKWKVAKEQLGEVKWVQPGLLFAVVLNSKMPNFGIPEYGLLVSFKSLY